MDVRPPWWRPTPREAALFRLTKWYLDCVSSGGTVFIGYAARLRWGRVRLSYHGTLLSPPGAEPLERHTLRGGGPPGRAGSGELAWRCDPLGVDGRWSARAPAARRRVYAGPDGNVDWACLMPSAEVRLELEGLPLEGDGYVERLRLTVPPWSLPLDTLRWGRFAAGGRGVVWLDWAGPSPRRLVLVDGVEAPDADLTEAGVVLPERLGVLELGRGRVVRDGQLSDVLRSVPRLARRVPPWLASARETKYVSPAVLRRGDASVAGWAVHEVVQWRNAALV